MKFKHKMNRVKLNVGFEVDDGMEKEEPHLLFLPFFKKKKKWRAVMTQGKISNKLKQRNEIL